MELWAGKASESSELNGLFCGSLDDRDVERNTNIMELWLVLLQREAKLSCLGSQGYVSSWQPSFSVTESPM